MKRILLFIACFLLIQHGGFARKGPLDYYKTINRAELAICSKDLPAASKYYRRAFKINPEKPFSRDLLNAFYCAMDVKQYNDAGQYLKRLLSRGVESGALKFFILKKFSGTDLDSVSHWLAVFPNDTIKADYLSKLIRHMHNTDQETRRYFSKKNDGKYMVDSVYDMDERNGRRLFSIFNKNGVPNEEKVGSVDFRPLGGPSYELLAIHASGPDKNGKDIRLLDTLLFKAVLTYDYSPLSFSKLINRSAFKNGDGAFRYGNYQLHVPLTINCIIVEETGKVYPQYFSAAREREMDRERALIGLETLAELRRKVDFSTQAELANNGYARYSLVTGVGVYSVAETAEQAKAEIAEFSKHKRQ